MKRKFDFIINKDDDNKTILRFYPKISAVHGFDDEPPKEWGRVYKTYMSFSILNYFKWDEFEPFDRPTELFSEHSDEGEGLRTLREILKEILSENAQDEYDIIPFGMGVDWEIYKHKRNKYIYVFTMLKHYNGQAYRFRLTKDEIQEFYNVLDEFLEYMLKHSVGI